MTERIVNARVVMSTEAYPICFRFATSYNITMFGDDGLLGKIGTASTGDYRALTADLVPTTLRVGASGKLDACALGLEINGRSLNMYYSGENESTATPCASQGYVIRCLLVFKWRLINQFY